MLKNRVIPGLLIQDGGLVKTRRFKNPEYVGDPINAIRIFNEKEVDELLVLDISATREERSPNYALIEEFASECFMPLAYGGGISSVDEARQLFSLGVEKICIQTSVFENPYLVREIADQFGEQSIIVSIDIKQHWLGRVRAFSAVQKKYHAENWLDLIVQFIDHGAGEILLNNVDRDGTLSGLDIDLIRQAGLVCNVPLIVQGGVSSLSDMKAAIQAGADAVAAGAFFVFQGPHRAVLISYPSYGELEQLFTANNGA